MKGSVVLPEQPKTVTTSHGFVLSIDFFQNAITKISHPVLDWHDYQDKILLETRKQYPGIEIWKKWMVTYNSSKGAEESIEVKACKSDLPAMFPTMIRAEDGA